MTALMAAGAALYLDTSVALRATLEQGTTPEFENRIAAAAALVTSRLSLVESARALLRVRLRGGVAYFSAGTLARSALTRQCGLPVEMSKLLRQLNGRRLSAVSGPPGVMRSIFQPKSESWP